tara:strand:- start:1446 stop:2360 length:915 start_codon:yes stop_codon:yes gene_type:complete
MQSEEEFPLVPYTSTQVTPASTSTSTSTASTDTALVATKEPTKNGKNVKLHKVEDVCAQLIVYIAAHRMKIPAEAEPPALADTGVYKRVRAIQKQNNPTRQKRKRVWFELKLTNLKTVDTETPVRFVRANETQRRVWPHAMEHCRGWHDGVLATTEARRPQYLQLRLFDNANPTHTARECATSLYKQGVAFPINVELSLVYDDNASPVCNAAGSTHDAQGQQRAITQPDVVHNGAYQIGANGILTIPGFVLTVLSSSCNHRLFRYVLQPRVQNGAVTLESLKWQSPPFYNKSKLDTKLNKESMA